MQRKIIALVALLAATLVPAQAQQTPKFGKAGGIGSASSTYPSGGGEPTGGTYNINGTTGVATLGGLVLPSQPQKSVLAAPTSANGQPTFRTLVPTDIPTLNQNTTGTAANVTGMVAVANGGTGLASAAANVVFSGPDGAGGAPGFRALSLNDLAASGAAVRAASVAAMGSMATTQANPIVRLGYYVTGDSAPLLYYPSASACSLASGNGDGGSQIKSVDNKCWIASFPAGPVDVQAFGAKCDGTTDDAASINAALTYAGTQRTGRVLVPNNGSCAIASTISVPSHVVLSGAGISANGSLVAKTLNMTMVSITGAYAGVENMYLNALNVGTNTAGYAISMGNYSSTNLRNLQIWGAFVGMDINGNSEVVDNVTVNNVPANGSGWMVGRLSTGATTVDARITNSTVGGSSSGAAYGQVIYDAGGLFEANNDLLFAKIGTAIIPGNNQVVQWAFFLNSALGDTNGNAGIYIDTSASNAIVQGISCVGCWAASQQNASTGANLIITNNGGGVVDGIHFTAFRNYSSAKTGTYIAKGTNISFVSSDYCSNGSGAANLVIETNVSSVRVNGGHYGGVCDSAGGAGASTGIALNGGNSNISITGVDFQGVATPISGAPTSDSVVGFNNGIGVPGIASAATITLPSANENFVITGTTPVITINNYWLNRSIRLVITAGSLAFNTGGNLCNAITATNNQPVIALWLGGCWSLR